ncbi:MAG: NAD-binding protein [Sulfitobacter sp.]
MVARMGFKVTLVTRSRLLPDAEPEVSQVLADLFRAEGVTVLTGSSIWRPTGTRSRPAMRS